MIEFAGRTAFVTGGANGVGLGIVRKLLEAGAKVAIADVRQDAIDRALASLDNREVMGVNLGGVINGVMTFAPRMKARVEAGEQSGGHITNTASMASFIGSGTPGIYNTAKFAVRGLSYSLRHSMYRYGIGVSVVHPGLVKSVIYASDDVRPDKLRGAAKPVDRAAVGRLAEVHEFGMEPDVIGARILEGVRENRANIFTHPDHRDELEELHREIMADYRDYPPDAGWEQRVGFERMRRDSFAETRRKADEI